MKITIALGAALLLAAGGASAGWSDTAPMLEFMGSGNVPGDGDRSKLTRRHDSVSVNVRTSGLDGLSAYTVWIVAFNKPKYCAVPYSCDLPDLPIVPGHDPRVQASIVAVTGGVVGVDGKAKFDGKVYEAVQGINGTEVVFGPGLLDARGAEIHVIVRGHGQASQDLITLFESISSYAGGCDTGPCEDQQVAVHRAGGG